MREGGKRKKGVDKEREREGVFSPGGRSALAKNEWASRKKNLVIVSFFS